MTQNKRLLIEANGFQKNPPQGITASPIENDLYNWNATVQGYPNTPYEGGIFKVIIRLPQEYPHKAPDVCFNPPVYHPSVDQKTGTPCLKCLHEWAPTTKLSKVLSDLQDLLNDPSSGNPVDEAIGQEFTENKKEFERKAREWTQAYAK